MNILDKCGINTDKVFAITSEHVNKTYNRFAFVFKLNMNISYYYLKKDEMQTILNNKKVSNMNRKTLKYNYGGDRPTLKLSVAKLHDHMFNINMGTSKRKDALLYLQEIANMYDELKDRKLRSTNKEIAKLSRDHAKDFKKHQREKLENPDELLKDLDIDILRVLALT